MGSQSRPCNRDARKQAKDAAKQKEQEEAEARAAAEAVARAEAEAAATAAAADAKKARQTERKAMQKERSRLRALITGAGAQQTCRRTCGSVRSVLQAVWQLSDGDMPDGSMPCIELCVCVCRPPEGGKLVDDWTMEQLCEKLSLDQLRSFREGLEQRAGERAAQSTLCQVQCASRDSSGQSNLQCS